jgi:alpha-tubulin suppressor-like RCC1 family protein
VPGNNETLVSIHQCENYSFYLDTTGKIFYTGEIHLISNHTEYEEFDIKKAIAKDDKIAEDVEDKILKLSVSPTNFCALTQKGKVFIWGDNTSYQIDDKGDQSTMVLKKMPGGEEEKCIDIAQGRKFHMVINDKNKLYGAGNYYLKERFGVECGLNYVNIPLPKDVKALRVWTSG